MSIDERELRSRLAESAALAGPPRFTTEDLAAQVRRIRRRRRRRAGIIAAVSAVAGASAVVIALTCGGTSQPVNSAPPPPPPGLSYTVTVDGQTRRLPGTGAAQLFTVTTGERLTMTVEVTVPGPRAMTALWLGITNGVLSGTPAWNRSWRPAPACRCGPARTGSSCTRPCRPGLAPGTSRQLSAEWAWREPEPGGAERDVVDFAVPLPSGAASPAAVARQLGTKALHAVTICDGARPAWIRAVRTTFGKAMATVGGATT